jgi:UPF0716 family protein affecting phage T7 exclusion
LQRVVYGVQVWELSPEQRAGYRETARDIAHAILFIVAIVLILIGGVFTSPADLGLIAAAVGLLGLVGIVRA